VGSSSSKQPASAGKRLMNRATGVAADLRKGDNGALIALEYRQSHALTRSSPLVPPLSGGPFDKRSDEIIEVQPGVPP
jgi:hypothetical protein